MLAHVRCRREQKASVERQRRCGVPGWVASASRERLSRRETIGRSCGTIMRSSAITARLDRHGRRGRRLRGASDRSRRTLREKNAITHGIHEPARGASTRCTRECSRLAVRCSASQSLSPRPSCGKARIGRRSFVRVSPRRDERTRRAACSQTRAATRNAAAGRSSPRRCREALQPFRLCGSSKSTTAGGSACLPFPRR